MENQKEGVCPVCGSSKVKYSESTPIEDGVVYPVQCVNCNSTFSEVYVLKFERKFNVKKSKPE